jgi:uncharacterized membrane protein
MFTSSSVQQLKSAISVHAPVEACYQAWINTCRIPSFIRRALSVQVSFSCGGNPKGISIISPEEIETRLQNFNQQILPTTEIRRWLISGPGGKLYEIEGTTILEIPNQFYCTISTDPDDIFAQSSASFMPDPTNQNTLIEWEVSFWPLSPEGRWTQFASAVHNSKDNFMEDCLQDFKAELENRGSASSSSSGHS